MTTRTLDQRWDGQHAPDEPGQERQGIGQELLMPIDEQVEGHVNLLEVGQMSLGSLLSNKLRSLLTTLGVIIGVASVVALMAIGNGASSSITNQVQSIGTNILTVSPGARSANRGPGSGPAQTLTMADAQAIQALHLPVIGVAPSYNGSAQVVAPAADVNAGVLGTVAAYQQLNSLTLAQGSFIDDNQVQTADPVIVLGANVATTLFGDGQSVGQLVQVKNQSLRVIGVLAAKGSGGFGSVDDRVIVPITVAQQRLFGARTPDGNNWLVSSITVSAQNSSDLTAISQRITLLLRDRHNLKADGSTDDFSIGNQAQFLTTLSSITNTLTIFLAAIASISLLVGGIGIMNIMLVSVTERTREIGLRKAVGARAQDILIQFVFEALAISLFGGLLGLGLGAAIAWAVSAAHLVTTVVSVNAVMLAVGFALAVGLFFGIYPAQRAARLNPIDALRSE